MKMQLVFVAFLAAILAASGALAAAPDARFSSDYHLRSTSAKQLLVGQEAPAHGLTAGTYDQSIDHSGGLAGQIFKQRYWIDTEYATSPATAPVIYHICGEGDATQDYFLKDNAINWAKALHANLVYLEHRYYGKSLPFADLSTGHLKYLTLDNVIADLADFQKWIAKTQGWTGKWVSIGGSYSGTLSAIYRQKHPELVVGALASSAPMISGVGDPEGTDQDVADASSIDPSSDTGDRQWLYQACTTFGFWETDGMTIYEPSSWLCQQLFEGAAPVDSAAYNQAYETPFISSSSTSPTNILFTYGGDDIWTTIGVSDKINQNPNITIQVISGAGHHFDLNYPTGSDSAAVKEARQQFVTLATGWLSQ